MTLKEGDLFAAYRNADGGYEAPCACGAVIASTKGDERSVAAAIDAHNATTPHVEWRAWQAAVEAMQRPTRRRCACHQDAP